MATSKSKRGRSAKRTSDSLERVVGTLVRRFQAYRREALTNEQRQAKMGHYKCAIQSHERAVTLLNVINALKSEMRSNK